jgi:hypothetical protein
MTNLFEPEPLFVEETKLSFKDKLRMYEDEGEFLDVVQEWCYSEGYLPIRINDSMHKGYSDLFIVVQGRLVCAELKRRTGKPSQHQLDFIDKVEQYGAIGGVCRCIAEVEDLCDEARFY